MAVDEASFLGTGWSFPPTFSRQGFSVEMVSDNLDIRESLAILFATAPGERVLLADYGCQIQRMVFRNIDATVKTEIAEAIRNAVLYWEPRIDVGEITVQPDATVDGLLLITVEYTIRKTNARSNLVYPFYFREGTLVARTP